MALSVIGRLQERITSLGILACLVYATATVAWLAGNTPGRAPERAVPALLVAATVVSVAIPGLANQVTWSRAWLAWPAYFYALQPSRFPFLVLTVLVAAASDVVDGTIARRQGSESSFGGALDPVVDGIFYGATGAGLCLGGLFPAWLAAVVIARYALPAAAGAVILGTGRRPELRHTLMGQVATTVIAALLGGAALLRAAGHDPHPVVVAAYFLVPAATLAAFANLFVTRLRQAPAG